MGRGETDWTLMDAYEIQMRTIPSVLRFNDRRKLFVGGILLVLLLGFAASFFFMLRTDLSFTAHLLSMIFCCILAIVGGAILIWFIIGVVLERQAYSKACRMAMEHDAWEREKFREEYQKTIKDHNYKN